MSTIAESAANHHIELQPGLERLGKVEEQFMVSEDFILNLVATSSDPD